jgi:hypothetical protein
MRNPSWYVAAMLFTVAAAAGAQDESSFVPLFDGKTLEGWTTARGNPVTQGWEVQDGAIVRTGGGGSIFTEREYGDFELRFDWRISRRGNSGVKYRVARYAKGIYSSPEWLGYEYQIWDDERRGTPAHMSAASIYLLQAPEDEKPLKPTGEFNTGRIVAVGPHLEHWLNGAKVLDVDTSSDIWWRRVANTKFGEVKEIFQNSSGRIQLQDHGNKVWFRNLRIRELGSE